MDEVYNTLIIEFVDNRKFRKFLSEIRRGVLDEYLTNHMSSTIWFRFPDKQFRDGMLETLKMTIPKYDVAIRNGQEQIIVK